jgi:GTP-binding protein
VSGKSSLPSSRPDPFRIVHADFLAAAAPSPVGTPNAPGAGALPAPVTAEIAFAGRSNVGKSSLINALLERKNLVRVSQTPGSTRQLNLYEARAADGAMFHLVDLPGYGFTRRSKAETASWAGLVEGYIRTRVTLAAVVILCDARRGLEDDDRELIAFVEGAREVTRRPVEVIVAATKLDKLPRSAQGPAVAAIKKSVRTDPATPRTVIGFSSVTGDGRRALWSALRRAALGSAPDDETPGSPGDPPAAGG